MLSLSSLSLDEKPPELHPWWRGFTGDIYKRPKGYLIRGRITKVDDLTYVITELPIGRWTQDYKQFLCDLVEQGDVVTGFRENHTDTEVMFTVTLKKEKAAELKENREKLMKDLRLLGSLTTSNFILFNSKGHIHHYKDASEIMEEFIEFRLPFYQQRRENLMKQLDRKCKLLENKSSFIQHVIDGSLVLHDRPIKKVIADMEALGLMKIGSDGESSTYDYLLNLPLNGLTEEKRKQLDTEMKEAKEKKEVLNSKESKDLWIEDLEEFKSNFIQMEAKRLSELVQGKRNQAYEVFTIDHYKRSQVKENCIV